MAGVQEAQFRTAYKKAYNTIVNYAAMASVEGTLPASVSADGANQLYVSMARNLSLKSFSRAKAINAGVQLDLGDSKTGLTSAFGNVGSTASGTTMTYAASTASNPLWLITEDNFSYAIIQNGTNCKTKLDINASAKPSTDACFTLVVDVNGLNKGPNLIQKAGDDTTAAQTGQYNETDQVFKSAGKTPTLKNDQYVIYLGRDGATAGNPTNTITGRIIADIKSTNS